MKTIFSILFIMAIVAVFLTSCGQGSNGGNKATADTVKIKAAEAPLVVIDTFSTFPPEIDGCSCYFSADSKAFQAKAYIYISDFDKISFLKINGTLTRFTLVETKVVSQTKSIITGKNDNYDITVEVNSTKQSGDETTEKTGTITIKDKSGKTITKTFYGECGC
jgi:hypothetical protein